MKLLSILGSTGSIGKNTLEVAKNLPDRFKIFSLTVHKNTKELFKQIEEFSPQKVVITDYDSYKDFCKFYNGKVKILFGEDGLLEIVRDPDVNLIVNSIVGFSGLLPTVESIKAHKNVAIANKEAIVVAGEIINKLAFENNVSIIPIDSEHNAILQLIKGRTKQEINKIILTASGGPFRDYSFEMMEKIKVDDALSHPNWSMGEKISVDSATMMNKGFEVIEAHYLYGFEYDKIEVIVHKESIIHSMIETIDGEIYAQLGPVDMKFPIQNALTYPEIVSNNFQRLNLGKIKSLNFEEPDNKRFPLLELAYKAGKLGGLIPTILNAANEVSVEEFIKGNISFVEIYYIIECMLKKFINNLHPSIDDIIITNNEVKNATRELIKNK